MTPLLKRLAYEGDISWLSYYFADFICSRDGAAFAQVTVEDQSHADGQAVTARRSIRCWHTARHWSAKPIWPVTCAWNSNILTAAHCFPAVAAMTRECRMDCHLASGARRSIAAAVSVAVGSLRH